MPENYERSFLITKFRGHNKFFKDELQEKKYQELRQHERTDRSLGSELSIFEIKSHSLAES